MNKLIAIISTILYISLCVGQVEATPAKSMFIKQQNGHLTIDGKPYYFIGTNYWYGPILGSTGQGGNRARLLNELDFMKENGITNLRVLVGADGVDGQAVKVRPALQIKPGVYNDSILDGLDFFMSELGKRDMHAVLYLNNSWEWSGGYGQYLEWAGKGSVPEKGVQDWPTFVNHVAKYAECDSCHILFRNHVEYIISRTNRYTGKKYIDDTSIMAWQVGNEPRAFSNEVKPAFVKWLKSTIALIRSIDPNHMISIGNEGVMGSEGDMGLFEEINSDPNVDYITIHIWPKNWSWIDIENIPKSVDTAITKTNDYINEHLAVAKKLNKPVVVEEFGFPRDNHKYTLDDLVLARDKYYANIFTQVVTSSHTGGLLAGCNFWAWGGSGRPTHKFWKPWDNYVGDPAQEEQGLNSVFDTDSTVNLITNFAKQVKQQQKVN